MKYRSESEQDTYNIALELGQKAEKGHVYCLVGDLGVGKTLFAKGFAKGLGIDDHITSPTFTIVNEYSVGACTFNHLDVYRIGSLDEMDEIGYEEYFYGEHITLVEWADLIRDIIPIDATWIELTKDLEQGFDYREIIISTKSVEL
ncbi:MAG: tRNA (adenosine(37)-N6)-threonylcarbamoyltransferase complex ATPase subunit type 1 TsaE [Vallitaleaceae bacterium]|jgi:tRNA threonylcarbamoyladenosine biosynthesis protein TsaE|nr:tRNA (adenosine(37)-N6)-threonylcarbamoyltransferase complex ATPase subunit type 1 TsaE [Vallitaleaceae bacterium]